jgi:hypothetical protein
MAAGRASRLEKYIKAAMAADLDTLRRVGWLATARTRRDYSVPVARRILLSTGNASLADI